MITEFLISRSIQHVCGSLHNLAPVQHQLRGGQGHEHLPGQCHHRGGGQCWAGLSLHLRGPCQVRDQLDKENSKYNSCSEILFPLRYGDIDFQFDNIGEVLRAGLDIIGDVLLETERLKMAGLVRSLIGTEVQSLVCEEPQDESSPSHGQNDIPHYDRQFVNLLKREGAETRDR